MQKKILSLLNTTVGQLVFALLAGMGYFLIISRWILDLSRGIWLILMYIAPIIICGAALIIIKLIKQAKEAKNVKNIMRIFWLHIAVIVIGIVSAITNFI